LSWISLRRTVLVTLFQAAKDVASQDALVDIFERIENFFRRLETYTEVPTTEAMRDIIVKIMVEVLGIFGIVTKEMKEGRASELILDDTFPVADRDPEKYLKKLVGRRDIEDALIRLDKLTQEEARMATAQLLKVAHRVEDGVKTIGGEIKGVDDKVKGVDDKVKGVDDKVILVDNKVNVAIEGTLSTLASLLTNAIFNPYTSRRQGNTGPGATDYKQYGDSSAFVVL
jgi:hypothetical protein